MSKAKSPVVAGRPASVASAPAAPADDRWKIALHEAGHVVVAQVLGAGPELAVLHIDGGGLARYRECASRWDGAIIALAGSAAEALSERYAAPDTTPDTAATLPHAPTALDGLAEGLGDWLADERRRVLPDWQVAAAVCIEVSEPERWAERYYRLQYLADCIVTDNAAAVVRVAKELFRWGVVTPRRIRALLDGENTMAVIDELVGDLEERKAAAAAEFWALVRKLADGGRVTPDVAAAVLAAANRTAADLKAAVALAERRIVWRRDLAAAAAAESERDEINAQIIAADSALAAAQAEYAGTVGPLRAELARLAAVVQRGDTSRGELVRTACDANQDYHRRHDALTSQIEANVARHRAIAATRPDTRVTTPEQDALMARNRELRAELDQLHADALQV